MKVPSSMKKFLLPMAIMAMLGEGGFSPTPDRIEAKDPVKSHGGAGKNIHKAKKPKRKYTK